MGFSGVHRNSCAPPRSLHESSHQIRSDLEVKLSWRALASLGSLSLMSRAANSKRAGMDLSHSTRCGIQILICSKPACAQRFTPVFFCKKERGRKEKPETRGSSLCYSADYKLGRMLTSECSPQNAHLTLSLLVTPVFQHDTELVSWMRRMWACSFNGA